MDDFVLSNLHEAKNEWSSRLLTIITPLIIEGLKSIFDESIVLCRSNNEMDKYLMTFQNLISRIPKWNTAIIDVEKNRIINRSGCTYMEDLLTCVHVIHLKLLTTIRVGQKQKKIDINIPKLDDFIHKIYIHSARKVYKNVYLFEINIPPLQVQKNNRELEVIIQECILNTIRESIPVESILRAYMDETIEETFEEEIKEQIIEQPTISMEDIETERLKEKNHNENITLKTIEKDDNVVSKLESNNGYNPVKSVDIVFPTLKEDTSNHLSFNDFDMVKDENNIERNVLASKDIDRLEQISNLRNEQRKKDEMDDDEDEKLNITDQHVNLDTLDIHHIHEPSMNLGDTNFLNDVEMLY
jgi:hypothetical protein